MMTYSSDPTLRLFRTVIGVGVLAVMAPLSPFIFLPSAELERRYIHDVEVEYELEAEPVREVEPVRVAGAYYPDDHPELTVAEPAPAGDMALWGALAAGTTVAGLATLGGFVLFGVMGKDEDEIVFDTEY